LKCHESPKDANCFEGETNEGRRWYYVTSGASKLGMKKWNLRCRKRVCFQNERKKEQRKCDLKRPWLCFVAAGL